MPAEEVNCETFGYCRAMSISLETGIRQSQSVLSVSYRQSESHAVIQSSGQDT